MSDCDQTGRLGNPGDTQTSQIAAVCFGCPSRDMAKADLCIWSSEASRWTELSPNGTLPSPRFEHTMVWSQADAAIYVFGGFEDGGGGLRISRGEPTGDRRVNL